MISLKNLKLSLLIDDGSTDDSWSTIKKNVVAISGIKGVKLSRSFGQHQAITAGLAQSKGNHVVVMDCDLQHDPKYIRDLLHKANEGYDIVYTRTLMRNHSVLKNLGASIFNWIFNFLVAEKQLSSNRQIGSYSIVSRKVVEAFESVGDYTRHYLSVLRWLGFSSAIIEIEHAPRFSGRSTYTLSKLVKHALDGIISQSSTLLHISIYSGFVISICSFLFGLYLVISYFVSGYQNGWTSLIVTIFFSTGIILISLGILGLYLGKIFEQVKGRPQYLIDELAQEDG